jgi:hypothetical protein
MVCSYIMRTTITLDDRLLETLKKRAAETDSSVSRLIEGAVRLALVPEPGREAGAFELVTYGRGGSFSALNVDKTSALLELDDAETYGRDR